jgi:alpha-1,2-glucosyltransferase
LHCILNYFLKDNAVEDEALHAKQAKSYYDGDFTSWDPRITTPPGLYAVSLLIGSARLSKLRVVNLIFGLLLLAILEKNGALVVTMPILFPFIFLYYTDCGSLFFVLLTEHLHKHEQFLYSSLVSKNKLER